MTGALSDKRIVNTRAAHQAERLNTLLRMRGAIPLDYPCIAISPPKDSTLLDAALLELITGEFDWLVLTSANTIFVISERLRVLGMTLKGASFRTAAVGVATAEAAQVQLGLELFNLPPQYMAESLAEYLPIKTGERILLPESTIARPILVDRIAAKGGVVSAIDAYQTICGQGGVDVPQLLAQKQIDALTFTSSSTVTCFLERLSKAGGQREAAFEVCAACIGSKTAATARDCGFGIVTTAAEHTLEGLLNVLNEYFSQQLTNG